MPRCGRFSPAHGRRTGFTAAGSVHHQLVQEPGLDEHEWQTRWEALAGDLAVSPVEALPEVARLVEDMLAERGHEAGTDPEIDREVETGRQVVARIDAGRSVDPGDVGAAVNSYRAVYEQLLAERRAP